MALPGRFLRKSILLCTVSILAGCAGMNYNSKLSAVTQGLKSGAVEQSLAELDAQHTAESSKDLLYLMERGQLLSLQEKLADSRATWLQADAKVKEWEETTKNNTAKLLGDIGSGMINDTVRPYQGRDYEKVFLNINLALNQIGLGEWDKARVEITKMHERQSIIAEFRAKEIEKSKEAATSKGIKATSFKELNGYPIQALEAPEVQSLKNSYESAFGNYLAGFIFEALGEGSLAAPGYRKAIEMRSNIPELERALQGLDSRIRANSSGKSNGEIDTLFVLQTGLAPAIRSQEIGMFLPIPCANAGICSQVVALSWPTIDSTDGVYYPSTLRIDNKEETIIQMTNIDTMAKRALYDEMPSIIARTAIRAIVKTTIQKSVDDNSERMASSLGLGGFGGLVSLATKVAVVATEVADERTWRTLPLTYSIVRTKLKPGKHTLTVPTRNGSATVDISVSGKYAVVPLRVVDDKLYVVKSDGAAASVTFAPSKRSSTAASNSNNSPHERTPAQGTASSGSTIPTSTRSGAVISF